MKIVQVLNILFKIVQAVWGKIHLVIVVVIVNPFLGGVDAFEDKLKAEEEAVEDAKEEEQQRRTQISSKTRNRLSKLLDRKRVEAGSSSTRGRQGERSVI